ncbi:MAG TPA: HYR domain-containing protein, partial [Methylomirabilota bacterium]|nr:HYR domain-containing protein [Methylomirabilota bacterium]
SNNLNSDDFAIVVYRELVPPMITCPVNVVTNCSGGGGTVVNFTVTATDDGDLPPTLTCVPASGSVFPLGQTTVTCTATDTDGLSSTCSFIVTVADSTPPIISCPSNFIVAFASEAGAAVTYSVVATDICDASPALTCAPLSGDTFPIGTTTVTCTASDVNGNSASCSFTVTVLGSRGVDESVLTELIALRSSVTDPNNGRKLDQAIKHLTKSTAAELWRDETHLEGNGRRVFREDAFTIRKLCTLIKGGQSQIPVAMLQGLVDRILQADRLLAFIAIQDAIAAGASSKKIDQAQKFLAKGDAAVGDEKCHNGVEHYRNAWKRAAR